MKIRQAFTKIKHVVFILALIVAIVGCTPKQEMKSIKSKYVKLFEIELAYPHFFMKT